MSIEQQVRVSLADGRILRVDNPSKLPVPVAFGSVRAVVSPGSMKEFRLPMPGEEGFEPGPVIVGEDPRPQDPGFEQGELESLQRMIDQGGSITATASPEPQAGLPPAAEPAPTEPDLIGSSVFPPVYPEIAVELRPADGAPARLFDASKVADAATVRPLELGDLVARAYQRSGLSLAAWNAQDGHTIERLLTEEYDHAIAEAAGL